MSLSAVKPGRLYIIAAPLTRPVSHAKSKVALTYYHFHITHAPASVDDNGKGKEDRITSRWLPKGGLVNWATAKATETWAGFGKQPRGWKRSLYKMGEKFADRLDFEELAVKTINPSLGPTIEPSTLQSSDPSTTQLREPVKIPLLYPPTINSGTETLRELSTFVSCRMAKHKKGFYLWALAAPLAAPISIIPIMPNIPFFFCAWRSWSHYRAYKGSQYLNSLLERNVIVPEESQLLDIIYSQYASHSPFEVDAEKSKDDNSFKLNFGREDLEPQHDLLLSQEAVPNIARIFSFQPSEEADLYRAIEQARLRVAKGQIEL